MSIDDFIKLNDVEQTKAIKKATIVGTREDEQYRIFIYQINDFYVDVFFHKELKVIDRFRPFKTNKQLAPFYNISLN